MAMRARRRLSLVVLSLLALAGAARAATAPAPEAFVRHFEDATLRIDYFHTGDAKREVVSLDQVYREGPYAGSRVHLVDALDLGRYCAKLYDTASGDLLWSRGFDSYFGEYRTTAMASAGRARTYHESVIAPYPKAKVMFALEARRDDGVMDEIFRAEIDPADWAVLRQAPPAGVHTVDAHLSGDPHACVDIAILGEGYTADQAAKFDADVARFAGIMLEHDPYASHRDAINVRGVLLPSQESGCDEPSRGVYRRTSLGCGFDALGSERYLLTEDNRALRDIAGTVPYDVLYVMVNHERYGGGGIYNLFCTFTSDNQWSPYVFLHEFGHCFAGLADEYYTSNVAYESFYPAGYEPRERNITALGDPGALKWGDLATPGPLPTPWDKAEYDAMDVAYQERRGAINDRIAALMRGGAAAAEVEAAKAEGEALSLQHQQEVDAWFARNPARDTIGAFEGAGYMSHGMYRSQLDCIMFTKGIKPFCAACRRGIEEVIASWSE
ncbi:MAG TPA: M64 family metallopeptidase [Candidatus Krumholzibacteria bacterium]|nr:M64 family metallopeptidase [Candidatus Krumholzibacteria bacterium]